MQGCWGAKLGGRAWGTSHTGRLRLARILSPTRPAEGPLWVTRRGAAVLASPGCSESGVSAAPIAPAGFLREGSPHAWRPGRGPSYLCEGQTGSWNLGQRPVLPSEPQSRDLASDLGKHPRSLPHASRSPGQRPPRPPGPTVPPPSLSQVPGGLSPPPSPPHPIISPVSAMWWLPGGEEGLKPRGPGGAGNGARVCFKYNAYKNVINI